MQKSELRQPKQRLELVLMSISSFWRPDGNSLESTHGPSGPRDPEQMQLALYLLLPVTQSFKLCQSVGVNSLGNGGTAMNLKGAIAFGFVAQIFHF